ncbi:hypothetical protein UFOVP891_29 [uncultured Caudovirales phage]|uniref:Uncharacterized protein n=1 Tax=uncultured Caudovirales phage TaxID=2100421 RepID=A0A6J5Q921_9CAUD|nr:hypothetical protein UFOVP472_39 [uncultured Caudovirales phage]CAB4169073.1 hypothetical protein UFOVP891_29 [uncultured Caudovirales phage]CAB4180779.1 hypothetical protein UFOVP1053_39 [uncultured Caudovirales phage]CAB4195776.1 hypothetical protein UFOVP1297_35 [uncultured Caudovirales phage]CAB4221877.1 hypothetical protein UFOVP1647_13 [uncultured Caudovirales phage]
MDGIEATTTKSKASAREQNDRLEALLSNWARWMASGGMKQFHVGGGNGLRGYTHYDTETERDKSDAINGEMVDTIIKTLRPTEKAALETEYCGNKWLYEIPIGLVLVLAREQVRIKINRAGIY